MKKAILITVLFLSGCSILNGIQAPSKVEIPYTCGKSVNIAHNIRVSLNCNGVDTVFFDNDTAIFIPAK